MSSPQVPHSVSGQIACLHGQGHDHVLTLQATHERLSTMGIGQIACPHGQGHDHVLTLQDTHELLSTLEIMTWHLADVWPPGRSTRGLCHKDSPDSKVNPYSKGSPDIPSRRQRQDLPVHAGSCPGQGQCPGPGRAGRGKSESGMAG